MNWNNASTAGGGAIANLNNSAGAGSGVGLSYAGGSLANNFNLATSASTGNNKMMSHYWNTSNDVNAQTVFWNSNNNGVGNTGTATFQEIERISSNGPRDNTATFTNLNAFAPNGYDVYVYVSGASPSHNEVSNNAATNTVRNFASPVEVVVGPSGLISAVQTGNNTSSASFAAPIPMGFGNNNPAGAGGGTGKSMQDPANLPAGSLQTILWPAVFKPTNGGIPSGPTAGGYYSTDFQGFVAGSAGVTDLYPLDYGPLNEWGMSINYDPRAWGDYYLNADYAAAQVWEPTFRGIPLSNYIKFENLSLDTLEILARNIHGMRNNGGSTSGIDAGGITGIQIVARASTAVVPEPTSIVLWSTLAVVGLAFGFRRIRK